MAPPIDADPSTRESGVLGARIAAAAPLAVGATHDEIDEGHCAPVPSEDGCGPPGRPRISASPCILFVPDLVTMLIAAPEVQPNSVEKARDITFISCTAATGSAANIVCRPHGSPPRSPPPPPRRR